MRKISLIAALSGALVISSVFCCCMARADMYAAGHQMAAQQGHENPCCPLPAVDKNTDDSSECQCHIILKSVIIKNIEIQKQSDVFLAEIIVEPLSLIRGYGEAIDPYPNVTFLSSDPPIFIKNSVYRL